MLALLSCLSLLGPPTLRQGSHRDRAGRRASVRLSALILGASCLLHAAPGLACSGPDAIETIAYHEGASALLFVASFALGGVAAFYFLFRHPRRMRPALFVSALVVLHPGWWLSARHGDCGLTVFTGSVVVTALQTLFVAALGWRRHGDALLQRIRRGPSDRGEAPRHQPGPRVVATQPLFALSPELLAVVRADRRAVVDDSGQRHEVFLLDPGFGPATYLTADGRVLWEDDGLWDVKATRALAFASVRVGLRKTGVQELAALLPERTHDAVDCDECGGSGDFQVPTAEPFSFVCMRCGGLGWRAGSLRLDEPV